MSDKNLSELLKLAQKFGLKSLKTPDFEFEFSENGPLKQAPRGKSAVKMQEVSPEDEDRAHDERLANLLIESPLEYEQVLSSSILKGDN